MTNLFAFRATAPTDMKAARDPVGPENDAAIVDVANGAGVVVCAWGNHGAFMERSSKVRALLADHKVKLSCLDVNAGGEPQHPLYLSKSLKPMPLPEQ